MPGITEDAPTAGGDELDDLFDYDVDNYFKRAQEDADRLVASEQKTRPKPADLGIEEEIQIVKKRAPIAKLDETRLLSPAGIPKLRRITKDRLKLKGKGHEFSDVSRLLTMYQLWLDDLYPRAKFADGLAIIEKLGHTKRMQAIRKEWINESKPKEPRWEDDLPTMSNSTEQNGPQADAEARVNQHDYSTSNTNGAPKQPIGTDEDMLFLTDDEPEDNARRQPEDSAGPPSLDELDALLAEDEASNSAQLHGMSTSDNNPDDMTLGRLDDDFADEEEAMAGMLW